MLSQAYQQDSAENPDAREIDPRNQLLWRMPVRRLEMEAMRDALVDAAADDRIADDTLQSLELLIRTTADARSPALKRPAR